MDAGRESTVKTPLPAWRWWLAGFGLFTLFGVLTATQLHFSQTFVGHEIPWSVAFRRAFEEWYLWGITTVGILWFCRRYPLEQGQWRPWVLRHLGASVLVNLLYTTAYSALLSGQRSIDGTIFTFDGVFAKVVLMYSHEQLIIYWLVVMAHHGWHYYRRSRDREIRTAELEAQLARARLDTLRMQLNPHFLFNTLNTISSLIHDHPDEADRMVVRLSELLRLSLDRLDQAEVPLTRELALLERYLEIERVRFEDRLTVTTQIESGLGMARVPCLILQPLVENAVRHGIEARESGGQLTIRARRVDGSLELSVADNGPGILGVTSVPQREGVGLSNTRARLRHLYGDRQSLELLAVPGGGLEVRITMPLQEEPESTSRGA